MWERESPELKKKGDAPIPVAFNDAIGGGRPRAGAFLAVSAVAWLVAIVGVMVLLLRYSATPGFTGAIPQHWPAGSRISFDAGRPNLVVFAHPRCPCTRATLGELEILMARCQGRLGAQVWFITPPEAEVDWTDTALWRTASLIPGVTVHRDDGMAEARRFGAGTSGQTLLFDRSGELLFQGGITGSRGHSGDNPGRSAVVALLDENPAPGIRTPVFGCPLFAADCQQGDIACKP